jgi:glycosyltransferase involved in cell wall biosynthesis
VHLVALGHSADLMGAELTMLAVVTEAVARGHRVTAVLPVDGPLRHQLSTAGATVEILPTRSWLGRRHNLVVGGVRTAQAMLSVRRYRRLLADLMPDVVYTNSVVTPAGALAARRLGLPHVWMVQESLLTNPTLRSALPRSSVAKAVGRWSDGVVVASRFVEGQLKPFVARPMKIINCPVDPLSVPLKRPPTGPLRDVLLLGRLSAEKGQREAVEAVGACAARGLPVRLTLAGVRDDDERAELSKLARHHGVEPLVDIVAWTPDTPALYARADATLMLSRNEAYGRVTLESLMCGTPVVGFRAGGTTEILEAGGGLLVPPSAAALASGLIGLASDPAAYAALAAAAGRRQRELAGKPSTAGEFVAHLESFAR